VDRILAVVETDPIFLSDVDDALAEHLYLRSMRGERMPADSVEIETIRKDLLEGLIERRIVIAKARKLGIEVTRTEVEDALDQWLADLVQSTGSQAAFESELERQGLTLKDFKTQYRKDIEEQLLVSRLMGQEFRDIVVTDGEIRTFFEAKYDSIPEIPEVVGISHIIIVPKVAPEREDQARGKVGGIMDRLDAGEPFEQVAREMSEDSVTRSSGGEIGTVALEDLREDIAAIASALETGQVSDPVRTRYGFEIVKVDSKEQETYTLRHIFVKLYPEAEDTLRAARLAYDLHGRAVSGESFESLAREYSDDSETRENGGYVGEIEVSALDDAYREGLSNLKPGDIADVIETAHGFQILKLVSRTASRKPGFDEVRDWIATVVETRKREARFQEWLDEARQEIYVRRMDSE
jgi:peptidyl-prolyl cis-trans isomerase SurA